MWRSFYDKRDAEDALDAMDGRMLDGRELRVQMARYGRPTSPHRRHGRSGRRRLVLRFHVILVGVILGLTVTSARNKLTPLFIYKGGQVRRKTLEIAI